MDDIQQGADELLSQEDAQRIALQDAGQVASATAQILQSMTQPGAEPVIGNPDAMVLADLDSAETEEDIERLIEAEEAAKEGAIQSAADELEQDLKTALADEINAQLQEAVDHPESSPSEGGDAEDAKPEDIVTEDGNESEDNGSLDAGAQASQESDGDQNLGSDDDDIVPVAQSRRRPKTRKQFLAEMAERRKAKMAKRMESFMRGRGSDS